MKRKGFTYMEMIFSTLLIGVIIMSVYYLNVTLLKAQDNSKNLSVLIYHNISTIEEIKNDIENNNINKSQEKETNSVTSKIKITPSKVFQSNLYYIEITSYLGNTKLSNDCIVIQK